MERTIIGLDGIERELSTVCKRREGCATSHGLRTTSGHMLRRTSLTGGTHEDIAEYGASEYGEALAHQAIIRRDGAATGHYAVLDWLYTCGCRGLA